MANIFSGLFSNAGQGQAGALARYNQELKDYQDAKDAYEEQEALTASEKAFQAMRSEASPALQRIMDFGRASQGSTATFDSGSAITSRVAGQRGAVIQNQLANEEDIQGYKDKRDYMIAHQDPTQMTPEQKLQLYKDKRDYDIANQDPSDQTSAIRNAEYFAKLGEGYDGPGYSPEQQDYLVSVRKDAHYDTLTGWTSSISGKTIPKHIIDAAFKDSLGDYAETYTSFPDRLVSTDNFLRETEEKRGAVQRLYGITDEGTTGWNAVFGLIPDTDAHGWKMLKEQVVANIGIDKLMAMKEGSAVGSSGLGALSDNEMKILTDIMGSLNQAGKPAAIKIVLRRLDREYGAMADNRKRRMRDIHKKNRRMEKHVPLEFRYKVQPEHEYVIMKEGSEPPYRETPLEATEAEAAENAATSTRKKWGLEE